MPNEKIVDYGGTTICPHCGSSSCLEDWELTAARDHLMHGYKFKSIDDCVKEDDLNEKFECIHCRSYATVREIIGYNFDHGLIIKDEYKIMFKLTS